MSHMIGVAAASRSPRRGVYRAAVAPTWSINPSLLTGAVEGGSTTSDAGTYDGTRPIYASHQWQSSADNTNWSDIDGATGATSPAWVTGDVGNYVRCTVMLTGPVASASYSTAGALVAAAGGGSLSYALTWALPETSADGSAVGALTSQKVYWSATETDRENAANSATVAANATTYTITGLAAGTYYAWVSAITAAGESDVSPAAIFTVS